MALPGSLPQRIFLLAHDPDKGRFRVGTEIGAMIRAAALADLYLKGLLTDERGRATVAGEQPCSDPVLATVLEEIKAAKPRKWQHWVDRRQGPTVKAVRQQLSDGGWIRVEPYRALGVFPLTKVTIRDPRVRKELVSRVRGTLRDPAGKVDHTDATMVAIVAAGELSLVLDRQTRRAEKQRIQHLNDLSGPIAPALRKSIEASASAAAA
ncbi:GPP34 family phosphoprotein [Actinoplanes sp. NPDC023801]|uniref:GOLPH3/VPS74 family protein n=1 Tax=Actinoplanes sp. NPDC023801 TaxID=3154595 RepID=UPI00340CE899